MTTDIKKLLDEAREKLADEYVDSEPSGYGYEYDHCGISFKKGFDANKDIILELVEAIRLERGYMYAQGIEDIELTKALASVEEKLRDGAKEANA